MRLMLVLTAIGVSFLSNLNLCIASETQAETKIAFNGKFEKMAWLAYKNREAMVDDLISNHSLIGLSREKIHELIGNPYPVASSIKEQFALKLAPPMSAHVQEPNSIEVPCLEIAYKNNHALLLSKANCVIERNLLPEGMPIPDAN